jgi:pimeloyl-ACP methyl ester carboxylesterase
MHNRDRAVNTYSPIFLLLACVALLTACSPADQAHSQAMAALQARTAELAGTFTDCERTSTTLTPAIVAASRCLIYSVAENPDTPDGRQIPLQVMVVPAVRPLPEPDPFVILVGGPGQAATVDALQTLPAFERIRRNRDILLVDQRGTGKLSPFDCDFGEDDANPVGSTELLLDIQNRQLRDCLDSIDAAPEYYTTDLAVRDLEALRAYLGYTALNLWGVSYGTRVALAYLKYFPDTTRTVVIDGVAPPGILPLEAARDGARALSQVLELCGAEPVCAAAFPDLRAHFAELRARYRSPVTISVRAAADGSQSDRELRTATIESALFLMLYSRETARLIPLFIEELYKGNFQVLGWLDQSNAALNIGMHYSVICSEDLPLVSEQQLAEAASAEDAFVYELLVLPRVEGCKLWPSRTLPPEFFAPVESSKPVLIFSATQDPVTPARWGDQVAATLSSSLHVVAEGIGHGVFAYGCAATLIEKVVESASVAGLDTACLAELGTRPFFTTWSGGVAGDD